MRTNLLQMVIKDRFQAIIKERFDDNKRQFALKIGVAPSVIENIVGARGGKPSYDVIDKVCANANISAEWLITGKGNMLKSDVSTATPCEIGEGIPLIPIDAMAGFNGCDSESVTISECRHYVVPEFQTTGCKFMIRVAGSSMYPRYSSGDILACRPIDEITFFQWGKIYVIDSQQGVMVKRIFECKDAPDSVLCVSDNERYPPFQLLRSEIRSLAIVVGAVHFE